MMRRSACAMTLAASCCLVLLAAAPAKGPFAIQCVGTAVFEDSNGGTAKKRSYDLPAQIYVFDEVGRRAQRALIPRQEFEDVCFRGGYIDTVNFAPGLINIHSEKAGSICDLTVNRKTGGASYSSFDEFGGGRSAAIEFTMNCEAAAIPKFDPSKNRF